MNKKIVRKKIVNKKVENNNISKILAYIICVATFFMSVGFSSMNLISLNVVGNAIAQTQSGIYLYEETSGSSSSNGSSSVTQAEEGTFWISTITLPNSDVNSSTNATVNVSLYNNSGSAKRFNGISYPSNEQLALYPEFSNLNSNNNIIIDSSSYTSLIGTVVNNGSSITIPVTFKYNDLSNISNNVLNIGVNFQFIDLYTLTIESTSGGTISVTNNIMHETKSVNTASSTTMLVAASDNLTVSVSPNTFYSLTSILKNGSSISNNSSFSISSNSTIKSTFTKNVLTINLKKDNSSWNYNNINVHLSTSSSSDTSSYSGVSSGTKVSIENVSNGTYYIWASVGDGFLSTIEYTGVSVSSSNGSGSAGIDYYTITKNQENNTSLTLRRNNSSGSTLNNCILLKNQKVFVTTSGSTGYNSTIKVNSNSVSNNSVVTITSTTTIQSVASLINYSFTVTSNVNHSHVSIYQGSTKLGEGTGSCTVSVPMNTVLTYQVVYEGYNDESGTYTMGTSNHSISVTMTGLPYVNVSYANSNRTSATTGTVTATHTGYYLVELWGGHGGRDYQEASTGGANGYVYAKVYLNYGDVMYYTLGGNGSNGKLTGKQSGGANGGVDANDVYVGSSAGYSAFAINVTDISAATINNGNVLMIAGGGGGCGAGNLPTRKDSYGSGGAGGNMSSTHTTNSIGHVYYGGDGTYYTGAGSSRAGHGGTTTGGTPGKNGVAGSLLQGGMASNGQDGGTDTVGGPGAGGYYGGGGGGGKGTKTDGAGGGGGGSSLISTVLGRCTPGNNTNLALSSNPSSSGGGIVIRWVGES